MDTAVIGVRFQEAGKIYYFEPGGWDEINVGGYVVVETSRGIELGRVVIAPGQVLSAELTEPLKQIIRPATIEDIDQADRLKERAAEATDLARQRARALNLPMKVVSAQYTLDGERLTVFFTSEGRVDFRDLIRDLGHHVDAQVQLRQIGPRDQAKLIGGYGRCGRRLCCTSWLTAFPAISIRMAKEQSLPLNPSKISGQCGRLLCCLSYENDIYKRLKAELPRPDAWVSTPGGNARVVTVNAIKQIVVLQMENLQILEVTVAQLSIEQGVTRLLPTMPADDHNGDHHHDHDHSHANQGALPSLVPDGLPAGVAVHPAPTTAGGVASETPVRTESLLGDTASPRPGGQRGQQPGRRSGRDNRGRGGPSGPIDGGNRQGEQQPFRPAGRTPAFGQPGQSQQRRPEQGMGAPPRAAQAPVSAEPVIAADTGGAPAGESATRKRRRRRRHGGGNPATPSTE